MYIYGSTGTLLDNRLSFMQVSVGIPMEEIKDYDVFISDLYPRI